MTNFDPTSSNPTQQGTTWTTWTPWTTAWVQAIDFDLWFDDVPTTETPVVSTPKPTISAPTDEIADDDFVIDLNEESTQTSPTPLQNTPVEQPEIVQNSVVQEMSQETNAQIPSQPIQQTIPEEMQNIPQLSQEIAQPTMNIPVEENPSNVSSVSNITPETPIEQQNPVDSTESMEIVVPEIQEPAPENSNPIESSVTEENQDNFVYQEPEHMVPTENNENSTSQNTFSQETIASEEKIGDNFVYQEPVEVEDISSEAINQEESQEPSQEISQNIQQELPQEETIQQTEEIKEENSDSFSIDATQISSEPSTIETDSVEESFTLDPIDLPENTSIDTPQEENEQPNFSTPEETLTPSENISAIDTTNPIDTPTFIDTPTSVESVTPTESTAPMENTLSGETSLPETTITTDLQTNLPETFIDLEPTMEGNNVQEAAPETISTTTSTPQTLETAVPEPQIPPMDQSQISSLLGDDPLGMLNPEPQPAPQVATQVPTQAPQQEIPTMSQVGAPLPWTYVPSMDALNQTVQSLESQRGVQAGFVNQPMNPSVPQTVPQQVDLTALADQAFWAPEVSQPQMVSTTIPQGVPMPQVPQMPQFQEGAPINQVSQVPTTPSLGNGNVVSLDQLGDMSFANPPISQAPATAPTVNATTQPTPAPQGGSKAMLVAFLILLPCVWLVVYFMMPDLFQPLLAKFTTQPSTTITTPLDNTGENLWEWELQGNNEENSEENKKDENSEQTLEETEIHGSAEEQNVNWEEENPLEEWEEDEFTWGYEEIKEISDEFFEFDDEEIDPFIEDEEEEEPTLSDEEKADIKKKLENYKKQGEKRLKTAKKEWDKNVTKYATFIISQSQNLLDDLENDTFDLNKYESSLKIIKSNLKKIDKAINEEA